MSRLIMSAITKETMSGSYIATAPNPVSQADFMRAMRRALRIPIGLPPPVDGLIWSALPEATESSVDFVGPLYGVETPGRGRVRIQVSRNRWGPVGAVRRLIGFRAWLALLVNPRVAGFDDCRIENKGWNPLS